MPSRRGAARRRLLRASAALLALQMAGLRDALAAGAVEKGVYRVRGDVRVNGVAAKLESKPSSLRLERITSPGPAACGRISQAGAPLVGTGVHQCAG